MGYREVQNTTRRYHMHPSLTNITISAHVRDLHRAMHPESSKRPRRPLLSRIRQSRS